ncbi:MAG: nucleoside deaminase [Oscillospiraceae bacterium]|nr:nucleoside deaminase [Oscillospiraceae bacterium]
MSRAIALAKEAAHFGETPVGAVVLSPDGAVIGRGRNRREARSDVAAHAEIEAMRDAAARLGDWRLTGCSLYVTLEPCAMCAGAIIASRVSAVYFGAADKLAGACGGRVNLFMELPNAGTAVTGGILAEECGRLLSAFFAERRRDADEPVRRGD